MTCRKCGGAPMAIRHRGCSKVKKPRSPVVIVCGICGPWRALPGHPICPTCGLDAGEVAYRDKIMRLGGAAAYANAAAAPSAAAAAAAAAPSANANAAAAAYAYAAANAAYANADAAAYADSLIAGLDGLLDAFDKAMAAEGAWFEVDPDEIESLLS